MALGVSFGLQASQPAHAAGTYTVNRADDISPRGTGSTCIVPVSSDCSLREAVIKANANPGSTITFASAINGTPITLTIAGDDDTAAAGDLDVLESLTITGNGAANTIIQAGTNATNGIDKVFAFNPTCATNKQFVYHGRNGPLRAQHDGPRCAIPGHRRRHGLLWLRRQHNRQSVLLRPGGLCGRQQLHRLGLRLGWPLWRWSQHRRGESQRDLPTSTPTDSLITIKNVTFSNNLVQGLRVKAEVGSPSLVTAR